MHTKTLLPLIVTLSTLGLPVVSLLQDNSAANQYGLLVKLVNTVVIGNYTQPNKGVAVPGILAPGKVNGTDVNLLPYFNGDLASSNRGGSTGVSVNFLDGGGAAPLKDDKPASSENAVQFKLLTHLYQFFGVLLGCSHVGDDAFPSYGGFSSMYQVHKFMKLDSHQVGYFITQVGLAASSFGVAPADIAAVAQSLTELFDYRCAPEAEVIKGKGKELQSICTADECPEAKDAVCDKYPQVESPKMSNGTTGSNRTVSTGTPSRTMTMESTKTETSMPSQATGTSAGTVGRQAVGGLVVAVAVAVAMGSL